jgi:para-aminobenzoate synthetase/4-amino-4-deoxychorismate lyase
MIRNDIGRAAETGTVQVPELFTIEKYPTLFQMTSTVQGRTRASLTDIFAALFPCASITGAPKVSTMKIISELETSPRKVYTGSIGYIAPKRKAQFNVAIRTVLIDRETETAEYGVGGGIVWDSTSAGEYDEALLKARLLTERRPDFSLLETILWTPQAGYYLLEKHLARMADSAEYFDYMFSAGKVENYLKDLAAGFDSAQRVRLLSDRQGDLTADMEPFRPQNKKFIVRLARTSVHSDDVFIYHKTTHRAVYESARGLSPDCDDALLYNQKGELTEFTIGNLVVELDGRLATPPVDCGLLPGVFRAHLIETGQVSEQVVTVDQLKACAKIYLVNSVRKWVEVGLDAG